MGVSAAWAGIHSHLLFVIACHGGGELDMESVVHKHLFSINAAM